jgi:ribosomal protein S18 acetylase RimI-like enzyme
MIIVPVNRSEALAFREMLVDYWRDLVPEAAFLGDPILAEAIFERRYRWSGSSNKPYWAINNGRRVGFLMYRIYKDGITAYIHDFFVIPDSRRQGIGTAIFSQLCSHLFKTGVRNLELGVLAHKTGAYSFWERQGFELESYRLGRSVALE